MKQSPLKEIGPGSQALFQESKLYRSRLRAFFASGCALSLLGFLLHALLMRAEGLPEGFHQLPSNILLLPPPIFFIFGILLVLWLKPMGRRLQWFDLLITTAVLTGFLPGFLQAPIARLIPFIFGTLVLWHAVLMPIPPRWHLGLVAMALGIFFLGNIKLAHQAVLEWPGALGHSIQMFVLLAISVAVNYLLHQTHRDSLETQDISKYRLLRELGTGGMGKVYAASHAFLCRPTAIKVMDPQKGSDLESAIARFEKEIRLSATLSHPNTITIFDYGRTEDDTFFYAMELLEGMDLQKLVKRFGPMPAGRAIFILNQVCGALNEAHSKGIIHRDIKPSNIFLSRQGDLYDFVKVLDFGMAKELNGESDDITQSGELLGTPRYIAPESVSSKENIDARTDIYLVGAVAYWMVTGKAPFEADSSIEVIVEHLTQPPQRPSEVSELEVPKELEGVILKCLKKNQEERFQTVSELADALRQVYVDGPWTQEKAKEWWTLHFGNETNLEVSEKSPATLRSLSRRKG